MKSLPPTEQCLADATSATVEWLLSPHPLPLPRYVFSAVVGTARCAVRAPYEGRKVCVTCTCGEIGSGRSHACGDIAARCRYPLNRCLPQGAGIAFEASCLSAQARHLRRPAIPKTGERFSLA